MIKESFITHDALDTVASLKGHTKGKLPIENESTYLGYNSFNS